MASITPTDITTRRDTGSGTTREQAMSMVFLFGGPAIAFVLAVLTIR